MANINPFPPWSLRTFVIPCWNIQSPIREETILWDFWVCSQPAPPCPSPSTPRHKPWVSPDTPSMFRPFPLPGLLIPFKSRGQLCLASLDVCFGASQLTCLKSFFNAKMGRLILAPLTTQRGCGKFLIMRIT